MSHKNEYLLYTEMLSVWKKIFLVSLLIMDSNLCPPSQEIDEPLLTPSEEQSVLDNVSGGRTCVSRIEVATESGQKAR